MLRPQLCYCLVTLALLSAARAADEGNQWVCKSDELCLRDASEKSGDVKIFESQHDCRLSCGKYGAIWPMPTGDCIISHDRVHIDPRKVRFGIATSNIKVAKFVDEAFSILKNNMIKECGGEESQLEDGQEIYLNITINSTSLVLDWNTDETYTLTIKTKGETTSVTIMADTAFGVRHAFETLSNLITASKSKGLLMVKAAYVQDAPIFPHRGVLLDTSRNYMQLHIIRNTLDAMATCKMNVFHWHVVDTHSFPLEITRVPELQRFGAYSPNMIYSRNDTEHIINYALQRGIRVLIEIDGPSHTGNGWQWGPQAGLGNLTVCYDPHETPFLCPNPPCGQLNPFNENVYETMRKIYTEIAELSAAEETIHMGGDEVSVSCWNSTEEITRKMVENGYDLSLKSFNKLWAQFHVRNLEIWDQVNQQQHAGQAKKPVIVWSSDLTDPSIIEQHLPKERFVIQTWVRASDSLNKELLALGYRIIISTLDAWYFDHGFWGRTKYYNWKRVYGDQIDTNAAVLGGEVCMWSEFVSSDAVEARIWPRAGAAAERLWSNPKTPYKPAQARFLRYRDRLIARGIGPDVVIPYWCVLNEGVCP